MPSSGITITSKSFEQAGKALDKGNFSAAAGRPMNRAIRQSVALITREVRKEANPHRHTGHMRSKIRYKVRGLGLNTVGRVLTGRGTNLVVGGTKPHSIAGGKVMPLWYAKSGKGDINGITGFATAVEHPGYRGDPFFDRAIKRSVPEVNGILDAAGRDLVTALAESMR